MTFDAIFKDRPTTGGLLTAIQAAGEHTAHGKHPTMHWLVSLGWIGLFGVALLDACPIPLPLPGSTDLLLLVLVVHKSSPWLLVPMAVCGSLVGGFLTWSAGKKGGEHALQRYVPTRYYQPITHWVKDHGALAVALAALLPPPVPLMPFLVAAGALGVTRGRFVAAFTSARVVRYGIVTWLGLAYGRHMVRWWNRYLARYSGIIGWVILGLFITALAFGIWQWRRSKVHTAAQAVVS